MSQQTTFTQSKTQTQPWRQHWPPASNTKTAKQNSGEAMHIGAVHGSWPLKDVSIYDAENSGAEDCTVHDKDATRETLRIGAVHGSWPLKDVSIFDAKDIDGVNGTMDKEYTPRQAMHMEALHGSWPLKNGSIFLT
ncbi:hypothetical protein LQW54_000852 [Pestalotiopsis sp. IQ-011]